MPLSYSAWVPGGEPAGMGSRYDRKMKWCTGFDSVGLSAYRNPKMDRMKTGTTHVYRKANDFARRRSDRAFRRFDSREACEAAEAEPLVLGVMPSCLRS